MAHFYYLEEKKPLTYEYWRNRFPEFLDKMGLHGGIGFVLARTEAKGAIVGVSGRNIRSTRAGGIVFQLWPVQ